MKKFIKVAFSVLTVGLLGLGLVACGGGSNDKKLTVGATPNPHQELLEFVKPKLEEQGYELEIKSYTDYVVPNNAVASREIDANFFQHQPYLTDFNDKNGTNIVSAGSIHFEPLGLYSAEFTSLNQLPENAKIAVPNDTSNEARALQLLEAQGLISLKEGVGLNATPQDIVERKNNIEIVELDAAQVARALPDVDFAVINGNYALQANVIDRVIVTEDPESEAATEYANIIAVLPEMKDDPRVKALVEALKSDETKEFIKEKYGVQVVAVP